MSNNPENLFAQLEGMARIKRPVVLQPGQGVDYFDPESGKIKTRTVPMVGVEPIRFEINNITADEALEAEAMITAEAPKIIQEQPSPTRVGTVMAEVGRDYEDGAYLKALREQQPLKQAMVCLFGCEALRTTTPGNTLKEKAESLVKRIPGGLLGWLSEQIDTLAALTAVGEDEVASFLASVSADTPASRSSKGASKTGGSRKSSTGKKARTSTSSSAKRRASGA